MTPLDVTTLGSVLVVVPHPDDESLGLGATLHALAGRRVTFLLASDGEDSHPDRPPEETRTVRAAEMAQALAALGHASARVVRLRLPDRQVDEKAVEAALDELGPAYDTVLAPRPDRHRDHRACAAAAASVRQRLLTYRVWDPPADAPPVAASRRWTVAVDGEAARAKAAALRCYASQLGGPVPVVPAEVVERHLAGPEVLEEVRR